MPETKPRRRLRGDKDVVVEEDATQGKLPEGFSDESSDQVNTINISEALTLLRGKLDDPERGAGAAAKDAANPVLQKSLEYLETFSRYKDLDTVRQLRNLLMEHSTESSQWRVAQRQAAGLKPEDDEEDEDEEGGLALTGFERAQLANLALETVEEAKNLIPTLETKDDGKLQALIDELATLRRFQA